MSTGKVYLVGAGPGEPDLLTLKALRLLRAADVIVHDRLIDSRILAEAKQAATLIDVGKAPGRTGRTQSKISGLLIDEARNGRMVVRLKGGDPFVFGRGGEEAEALAAASVSFEVVPGVTSAIAAPAYAGIPLTHRDHASSFTVVTGSLSGSQDHGEPFWRALAQTPGTLVVLMGWRNLSEVATALIQAGKPRSTPTAVVSWGTQPWQKTASGPLESIVEAAESAGLSAPAAVVIGDVVTLRERINWFEELPLLGRRVLVTRTRHQAGVLSRRLADLGALPVEVPTVEIRQPEDSGALDAELSDVSRYDWIVFTSANVVHVVAERLSAVGLDSRAFHAVRTAVIGTATAEALAEIGIRADLTPGTATSEGLAAALAQTSIAGSRLLLPRADIATRRLPDLLESYGASVQQVTAYRTLVPAGSRGMVMDALAKGIDVATFTSSSTVRNLLRLLDPAPDALSESTVACIGPVTAATASRLGLNVDIVAETPTIDGLIDKLVRHFAIRK